MTLFSVSTLCHAVRLLITPLLGLFVSHLVNQLLSLADLFIRVGTFALQSRLGIALCQRGTKVTDWRRFSPSYRTM